MDLSVYKNNHNGEANLNDLTIIATFSVESTCYYADNHFGRFNEFAHMPYGCYAEMQKAYIAPFGGQFNRFTDSEKAKEVAIQIYDKYNENYDFTTDDHYQYAQVTYFCIDSNYHLYQICKAFYDIK